MRLLLCALVLAATACTPVPPPPVTARMVLPDLPPMRRFAGPSVTPPRRANADMAEDFMDLSFRLESGRELAVFTRFEGPVRVRMIGAVPPSAPEDLRRLLSRLRNEAGIDIIQSADPDSEVSIEFLPLRTMQRMVPQAACFVAPRVGSSREYRRARRAMIDWYTLTSRERAVIFIPSDTAPQEVRDCLHEELAQALGPLNDLYRLPDSVFNDDNIHTVLTGFDILMLRAYYAPELRNGMTARDVAVRLPALLARLNPRGEAVRPRRPEITPRAYADAIETALGPGTSESRRRSAAVTAMNIARANGWRDARAGFTWLALGRLSLGYDAEVAEFAFRQAAAIYHSQPGLALHAAHADMQLAAFALSQGRANETIALADASIPAVSAAENAALLAHFLMVKAEALDMLGRSGEARQVRLDSLGWARYGFASDTEVWGRLMNIAALSPVQRARHP
ncbi:DUF2927 domain-containing protein [Defluviimonas salinarum]|uniref:DUF2927 domain-containing protein n=1 Tax=Defluviimonas salinarum TaxID=2992147 RepID=A0ABT3IXQ2_9RHOB|nr:DUF2927 domain-containing protein [Defluviimonas salinarum]MCW3780198.1 DUF2927 domain-containing protein [Defluviimonas salinarum]